MPIVRIDLPEGYDYQAKSELKRHFHRCIEEIWAKEHIYIAICDMFAEPGEQTYAMVTVDLRSGRGHEVERTQALGDAVGRALEELLNPAPQDYVLLVRQFPPEAFATAFGPLPDLQRITPDLRN